MAKVKLLQKYDGHKKGTIIDVKSTEVAYLAGMGIAVKSKSEKPAPKLASTKPLMEVNKDDKGAPGN